MSKGGHDLQLNTLMNWISLHAFGWLLLGNVVGVLLASLLVWPQLNNFLSPFTYGRWMPLHLDFHLYGWASLPLLAFLFRFYLTPTSKWYKAAIFSVSLWSLVLLAGGWEWLHGRDIGKIFLDWEGVFRFGFPLVLGVLWIVLAGGFAEELQTTPKEKRISSINGIKVCLLTGLAFVPFLFFKVLSPQVYPAINESSGGPTGVNLLGSVLGVVALFWLLPWVTGLPQKKGDKPILLFGILLAAHLVLYALMPHGNSINQDSLQIFGLGTTLVWIPLLKWYFSSFIWPLESRSWLLSFGFWAVILCVTGFAMFLPGLLEQWKFTNVLVAHAHLAMAGMMTSFNFLLFTILISSKKMRSIMKLKKPFILWHAGLLITLVSLVFYGHNEGMIRLYPFSDSFGPAVFYGLRLLGGCLMLTASLIWFEKIIFCRWALGLHNLRARHTKE